MLLSRGGWVLGSLAVLSVWLIGPNAQSAWISVTGPDFPRALLGLASLLQLALACWVSVIVLLAQLGGAPRIIRAVAPELLRQALFVSTAGALIIAPAQAERGSSPAHATQQHSLDGLGLPDRPLTVAPTDASVVVKRGDTLWAIAARSLPADATNSEIADACRRWYSANRHIIGANPDLIHPSQHLTPPTKDAS